MPTKKSTATDKNLSLDEYSIVLNLLTIFSTG